MRECLGWITNCPNEHSCPQNWLELAASEIPTDVVCHVCDQTAALVATEGEFQDQADRDQLVAYPVVPCGGLSTDVGPATPEVVAPRRVPSPQPPELTWHVTLSNGEVLRVDKDTMLVGRSRTCDVVLPSAKVSRQHASMSLAGANLFIEDLGSANGVWVNGEKITRIQVTEGDVYTISDMTLTFDRR